MELADLDYNAYADLLVSAGVNLPKGGNLIIRCHPEGILLARKCAEAAYARGAGIVELIITDPVITRARVNAQAGDEAALTAVPGWISAWEKAVLEDGWGYLALISHETPGALAECDQDSLMRYEKGRTESMKRFRDAVGSHAIPWSLAAVPGPRWAADVLGEGSTVDELWDLLRPILLLDRDDPAAAWKTKAEGLIERSKKLDALRLDSLHFEDAGTDLTIGLTDRAVWVGGPDTTEGRITMPNIPTEEVFTTPDMNRCSGHVRVTRPVEIRGTIVRGAEFTFEDGMVTDFDAAEGRDALAAFLDTDPGARRPGEIALVGEDSPIAASGRVFGSILFDENASCHIALGAGYPGCLGGGLTDDEKKRAAACNVSLVHVDFMIGSPGMTVTGTDREGRKTEILRQGVFVI